jgi:hypothetical protein
MSTVYIAPHGTRFAVCMNDKALAYFDCYLDAWRLREASRRKVEVR